MPEEKFNEHSSKAQKIIFNIEMSLLDLENKHKIAFKTPYHDIARRLLNEVRHFEGKEGGKDEKSMAKASAGVLSS